MGLSSPWRRRRLDAALFRTPHRWPFVPRRTITTEPLQVTETGHVTEFLLDDGRQDAVLVGAPHGGRVEPGTAEQAVDLATRLPGASCWARLGFDDDGEEFERYHPPSTGIDPADHPQLASIADRGFRTVVCLHGLADDGLLVGGGMEGATKGLVRDRLDAAVAPDVQTVASGPYAGVSPENVVNWLAADGRGGLQLEQGPDVRDDEAGVVTDVLQKLVESGAL